MDVLTRVPQWVYELVGKSDSTHAYARWLDVVVLKLLPNTSYRVYNGEVVKENWVQCVHQQEVHKFSERDFYDLHFLRPEIGYDEATRFSEEIFSFTQEDFDKVALRGIEVEYDNPNYLYKFDMKAYCEKLDVEWDGKKLRYKGLETYHRTYTDGMLYGVKLSKIAVDVSNFTESVAEFMSTLRIRHTPDGSAFLAYTAAKNGAGYNEFLDVLRGK